MLKLDSYRDKNIFDNLSFVEFLDLDIFADHLGSQNVADPRDQDPKH